MGEFRDAMQHIMQVLAEGEGIRAADIPTIIGQRHGPVNCYPGVPGVGCRDIAFFVSLASKRNATGKGHLSFGEAIETVVRHMQGYCKDITRAVVIITDSWDAEAYEKWRQNIEQIRKDTHIEAYLLIGRSYTEIQI